MKKNPQAQSSSVAPRTVSEEYELAKKERRQPLCVYCGEPLELVHTQSYFTEWRWNEKTKSYRKIDEAGFDGGDAEAPSCINCWVHDWDFVDDKHVFY